MSLPSAPGHVWKGTEEGFQHQVPYDDHKYDDQGRIKARCGDLVAPVQPPPACPSCLVASPANDLADAMEARGAERLAELPAADDDAFRRDR